MAKSMKPGGGGKFAKLTKKIEAEGKPASAAKAIAAAAGRKKYGSKQMAEWSSASKKRAKRK